MFKYLDDFPSSSELNVLISLYNDVRDAINQNTDPDTVHEQYINAFPQYIKSINRQYTEDKELSFPAEVDIEDEILEGVELQADIRLAEQDLTIEQINELYNVIKTLNQPAGEMILECEHRFNYLDKHYMNCKLGFAVALKDW